MSHAKSWLTLPHLLFSNPSKNLEHRGKGGVKVPCRQHSMHVVKQLCWENSVHLHETPLGDKFWKLVPDFFWALPYLPFPLADFNWYSFAEINHNFEYNSLLESCVSFEWIIETRSGLVGSDIVYHPLLDVSHHDLIVSHFNFTDK